MEVGVHNTVFVLHGHTPASKGDHLTSIGHMEVVQGCLLELHSITGVQTVIYEGL